MHVPTVSVADVTDPASAEWVVLDVREPFEWQAGHIEDAVHIPLHELPSRVGELDPQARTLVVCHVGARLIVRNPASFVRAMLGVDDANGRLIESRALTGIAQLRSSEDRDPQAHDDFGRSRPAYSPK